MAGQAACRLSISARLPELQQFLGERIGAAVAEGEMTPTLHVDAHIRLAGATSALVAAIQQLAPFGAGNPEPRFVLPSVRVMKADVVGKGHVRCILSDGGKGRLKAIAFRAAGEPLGAALLGTDGLALHLAGKIRPDTWQGRDGVQLIIDDGASAEQRAAMLKIMHGEDTEPMTTMWSVFMWGMPVLTTSTFMPATSCRSIS